MCLCTALYAQQAKHTLLTITVRNVNNEPVAKAVISLLTADSIAIIFAKSDEKGLAYIQADSSEQMEISLVKVSAAGYEIFYTSFSDLAPNAVIQLTTEKAITLTNVTVRSKKRPRIKVAGDTLSYAVKDFQHQGDRTLSDVLQRLPGLSVDVNGKVSYNGQAISNLYIEGDDILDGRYERATRNIRSDLIDTIQVLERNQHIRMLQGIVVPDKTAINISLKPDATAQWFHQVKAGAGIGAYDAGWNAMMVKPVYKAIFSAASNKIGETNVSGATLSADDQDVIEDVSGRLSAAPVSTPALPFRYWLNNRSTLLTANQFWKTKRNRQFRLVAGYGADYEKRNAVETFFFPGLADTVVFSQSGISAIRLRSAELNGAFIINTDKQYTEFSLKTNLTINHAAALWMASADRIDVQLKSPVNTFDFKVVHLKQTGSSGYLRFRHHTRLQKSVEEMEVRPGVLKEIINNNEPFLWARQGFNQRPLAINNSAGWHQSSGVLRQAYTAGFNVFIQNISSALATGLADGSEHSLGGVYKKTFSGSAFMPYLSGEWSRIGKVSELNLTATATHQSTGFANEAKGPKQIAHHLLPYFSLRYRLPSGKENELRINTTHRTSVGTLSDLFDGAVLADYRTLSLYNRQLQLQQFRNYAARYIFKKSVSVFSAYAGIAWQRQHLQNLDSLSISQAASVQLSSSSGYQVSEWRLNTGASKYIFPVNITINIKAQVSEFSSQRLQNGFVVPYRIRNNEISTGVIWQPKSKYYVSYNLERKAGRLAANSTFENWRHHAKASLQFTPSFSISPSLEYFINELNHQNTKVVFSEFALRYTIPKKRIDIELEGQNLFNEKYIRWMVLDQGFAHFTEYPLRPRTLLLRLRSEF